MRWYFDQVHSKYLKGSNMYLEGDRGGDIVAISAILQVDVYVSNRFREKDGFGHELDLLIL